MLPQGLGGLGEGLLPLAMDGVISKGAFLGEEGGGVEEEEEGKGPYGVEVHTSECASNSCILGRRKGGRERSGHMTKWLLV